MAGGLGFLAGLGQAAQGLPQGLAQAQTLAQQQEHAALLRAQLAQNQQQFDATRLVDVPTEMLPEAARAQAGTAPTVRQPTTLLPFLATQGAEERKNALQARKGAVMGNALRQIGTPESMSLATLMEGGADEKSMAAAEQVMKMKSEADRRTHGNSLLAAIMSGDQAKIQAALAGSGQTAPVATPQPPGQPPLAPPRFMPTGGMGPGPSPTPSSVAQQGMAIGAGASEPASPDTQAARAQVGQAAQRVAQVAGIPPSGAPAQSGPLAGSLPTAGETGMPGVGWKLDPSTGKMEIHSLPPKERQVGPEYLKQVDVLRALEDAGVPQTDPRWIREARHLDRLKAMALQQGGFLSGPSGGPPIAAGPPPPVTQPIAQDLRGLASVRAAAEEVKTALKDPAVLGYIGPYAQYKSRGQMMAPGGIAGQVPTAVVDMEQNLKRIQNYTIKLITGAQMSEQEARRIMSELPDQGTPPDVFARRLDNSMAQIQRMEQLTVQLALRGDQQAIRTATELGLMKPGQQGAQPAAPGTSGVVKWGRDAQGNPVRLP